ncbi:MAG TPA: outer membrane lipoprotein carrier protein LolA [Candidatus Acidoferrales bacterium]|nr:outer membrane lipoprotein carrier protein LolA [Candidatus Acidoferrales bacterium]
MNQLVKANVFALTFLSALLAIGASGQTLPPAASDQAKPLTHLLEEHYRRPRTLQAVFLERFNEGKKQERVESGTVYFRRPGQMRWDYDSPEKKLFLVDGKTTWFYVPYDRTVTKSPVKESSDWRTPLSLLTGKADLSRMCSKIDLVSQPGIPSGHATLRCVPKGEKRASSQETYTEVLLEVDTSSGELARIEIHQPGGIDLEYRFGNWQTDIPLTADLFKFQIPVGVAIVNGASMEGPQ